MTKSEFDQSFKHILTAKGLARPTYSVVIPVVWHSDHAELLLEVRASGISQAGDPCFPGGRINSSETPAQAAARELEEELGIQFNSNAFLGQLPTVHTMLGLRTDVYVCSFSNDKLINLYPNSDEVAEVLQIPVSYFLSRSDAAQYTYGRHVIWGMTAGAINNFCTAWKIAETLH